MHFEPVKKTFTLLCYYLFMIHVYHLISVSVAVVSPTIFLIEKIGEQNFDIPIVPILKFYKNYSF